MTTITYTNGYLHVSTATGDHCFQVSSAEMWKFISTLGPEYKIPALTEEHKPIHVKELAVGDLVICKDDAIYFYGIVGSISNDEHHNEVRVDDVHDMDGDTVDDCLYFCKFNDIIAAYRYYGEPQKNGLYKDTDGKYFWRYSYGGADERPWIKLTGESPEWTFFDDIWYVIQFPLTMIAEME